MQAGFSPGRPEWLSDPKPGLVKAVRLWPYLIQGEGHFLALLRKIATAGLSLKETSRKNRRKIDPAARKLFDDFSRATMNISFDRNRLAQKVS